MKRRNKLLAAVFLFIALLALTKGIVAKDDKDNSDIRFRSEEECAQLEQQINEMIDEANSCKVDSDCEIRLKAMCPFGCYNLTYKNSDITIIESLMDQYWKRCSRCMYECVSPPPQEALTCKKGKCLLGGNFSDKELLKYAKSKFDKEEMMHKDFTIGHHIGVPVRVTFPCSDVCPDYTIRIIRYDINLSECDSAGGKVRAIYVPEGIAMHAEDFCFPQIFIDNAIYKFVEK